MQHVAGASSDAAAEGATEHAGYVGETAEYSGGVEALGVCMNGGRMRLQVTFNEDAYEELTRIREKAGLDDHREVLGRALGAYEWLLDKSAEGYAVGAFSPSKNDGHPIEMRLHARWSNKAVRRGLFLVTALLLAAIAPTARADCATDDFECGLSVVELGQTPSAAPRLKSQLVERDTKTPKVIGAVSGIAGGLSLVAAWTLYVARQNTRLEPRYTVTADDVAHWESLGTWNLGLAAGGSLGLIAASYLLLPHSDTIPFFAWLGGAAGLAGAAIGTGYLLGASSCAPIAIGPGAQVPKACLSGTADSMFGVTLLLTAAPLLNLPLVYLFRDAFAGAPESLTLNPTGISGKF